MSIGNDLKAAATDALKKCAAELGVAADIYNKQDFQAVKVVNTSLPIEIVEKIEACTSFDEIDMLQDAYSEEYGKNNDFVNLLSKQTQKIKINGTA